MSIPCLLKSPFVYRCPFILSFKNLKDEKGISSIIICPLKKVKTFYINENTILNIARDVYFRLKNLK